MFTPLWLFFQFETPSFIAELNVSEGFSQTTFQQGIGGAALEAVTPCIAFYYLFSRQNFSPYLVAGAGLGVLGIDSVGEGNWTHSGVGPAVHAGLGLAMFRLYQFRVLMGMDYFFNFSHLPTFGGPHHGIRLYLGIATRASASRLRACGLGN